MNGESSVRLIGVEKRFGDLVAVRSIDLDITAGEFFSVIGPSGCGKTTTLRMIAGFERPTQGTIEIAGREVSGLPPYRRPVNTVFQSYALFPHLDVFENVAFGLREAHVPRAELRRRVAAAISLAQLDGREQARPNQLSGGQQQRVALARALVNRPEVLLLDEPLGSLDLKLRKEMQAQLKDMQREVGITFVYVTHDQEEAFSMSDRVAVMNHGELEQVGHPEDVYRRPKTPFVASFVGLANRLTGRVAGPAPGERYEVDLDHLGRRLAHGPPGLAAGVPVLAVVRPEDLHLTPAADIQPGQAAATVVDVAFLGAHRTVRLDGGALGQLAAIGRGQSAAGPDDKVAVSWADDDAWLVPVAEEDALASTDAEQETR
ncbi:MAG TPA: ABC transporter ATP-binding protein [Streptosporangiaceae bacterium]|nr:ABC transporter ATP-binding protein [Streptosporangiaceae bacterium]